jgi:hypothetical protein
MVGKDRYAKKLQEHTDLSYTAALRFVRAHRSRAVIIAKTRKGGGCSVTRAEVADVLLQLWKDKDEQS